MPNKNQPLTACKTNARRAKSVIEKITSKKMMPTLKNTGPKIKKK